jgi:hypothetical protein
MSLKRGRETAVPAAGASTSPYADPMEARAARTLQFIQSLRLTVPLRQLQAITDRRECPKCKKHRRFYCYDCFIVVHPETHPPPLRLPVSVHVVLHPGEHRSKATTIPGSLISPDVTIHTYPAMPSLDAATTVVLYPSEHAASLQELDLAHIKNVVFIDSTWQQSKAIAKDERVVGFRHVKIERKESLFWRFQDKDPSYLATIEAIYYFLKTFVELQNRGASQRPYNGEVDDLLAYYANQYVTVQQSYQAHEFTSRHFTDYIIRGVDWAKELGLTESRTKEQTSSPT